MPVVLIVSERFAPHRDVSAIRTGYFARHLVELGWDVVVATRRHGMAGDRVRDVDGATVVYVDGEGESLVRRPPPHRRLAFRVRSALDIPDANIRFWQSRVRAVRVLAEEHRVDAVVTSSPPHALHAVGRALSTDGLTWVADFRDALVGDRHYGAVGLRRLRAGALQQFEASIYDAADVVVHAIPAEATRAGAVHGERRARQLLITNGVPDRLLELVRATPPPSASRAGIVSVGTIGDRELRTLADAVAVLRRRGTDARLEVAGPEPDTVAAAAGVLGPAFTYHGRLDHDAALALVAGASVLVSALDRRRQRRTLLSSKLYEYAATGKPIVTVNPTVPDRVFLAALRERGVVDAVEVDSPSADQLADALERALATLGHQTDERRTVAVERYRSEYARSAGARRLDEALRGAVRSRGALEA